MVDAADERFTWTSTLIDAVLALRFKDTVVCGDIERAKGNEAKRKAWTALSDRLQKEQGVGVPENKLRRVISKWQSQHRSWVQTTANKSSVELAMMERPPTYMPVLHRYFQSDGNLPAPSPPPQYQYQPQPQPQPATIPIHDKENVSPQRDTMQTPTPVWRPTNFNHVPERPRNPLAMPPSKQRKVSPERNVYTPTVSRPMATTQPCVASFETNLSSFQKSLQDTRSSNKKEEVARVTHHLVNIQEKQLTLQKKHFEEQLSLQRKQHEEQFALQRKQIEAVQEILQSLHGVVSV